MKKMIKNTVLVIGLSFPLMSVMALELSLSKQMIWNAEIYLENATTSHEKVFGNGNGLSSWKSTTCYVDHGNQSYLSVIKAYGNTSLSKGYIGGLKSYCESFSSEYGQYPDSNTDYYAIRPDGSYASEMTFEGKKIDSSHYDIMEYRGHFTFESNGDIAGSNVPMGINVIYQARSGTEYGNVLGLQINNAIYFGMYNNPENWEQTAGVHETITHEYENMIDWDKEYWAQPEEALFDGNPQKYALTCESGEALAGIAVKSYKDKKIRAVKIFCRKILVEYTSRLRQF